MSNKSIVGIIIAVVLTIFIGIFGIIELIAVSNLKGISQRSQVSADIRTAAQIGTLVRIWTTDVEAGENRTIPGYDGDPSTSDILWYAYSGDEEGFEKFAGIDYYVGEDYKADSLSNEATYFISSIGEGTKQKIIVGIDELSSDGKTPKTLKLESNIEQVNYDGSAAGWAYIEQ